MEELAHPRNSDFDSTEGASIAYVIALPCVGTKDGSCVTACPVDAIHPRPDSPTFDNEPQLYINPGECICCGLCVDECPVNAIFDESDLPAEWQSFIEKNAAHFRP